MSDPRRVGLLFGGRSVEHEVSVDSARSVAAALTEAGFEVVPLGVTGEGRWLSPELSSSLLRSDAKRVDPGAGDDDGASVAIAPGGSKLLCVIPGGEPRPIELDAVFPLIHGWGGEDGRTQGALDLAGIPCVGAGVVGSAIGMDKVLSRRLLEAQGLPTVRWMAFGRDAYNRASETAHRSILSELELPLFVKPANGGSSVGISKVSMQSELGDALEAAFAHDGTVVVEEGIDAREIECAVMGNDRPQASGLGEIVPSREFYDYEAKYVDGTSELKIPAPLDDETTEAIRAHALTAFRSLGLAGLARVDFLVDRETGQLYLNEVNTLPGFTSISMFPKLWEAAGVAYPRLVARLVELAFERWEEERSHRTVFKPA